MNVKMICLLCFFNITTCRGFAQTDSTSKQKMHDGICIGKNRIKEVSLYDTSLIRLINNFIDEQINVDSFFRVYGYIRLVVKSRQSSEKLGTNYCFTLSRSYYYTHKMNPVKIFPPFYTYLKGRLILIYDDNFVTLNLNNRKKNRMAKKINEVLPLAKIIKFNNENGRKVKLYPMGKIVIDSEKSFCL